MTAQLVAPEAVATFYRDFYKSITYSTLDRPEKSICYLDECASLVENEEITPGLDFRPLIFQSLFYVRTREGRSLMILSIFFYMAIFDEEMPIYVCASVWVTQIFPSRWFFFCLTRRQSEQYLHWLLRRKIFIYIDSGHLYRGIFRWEGIFA